jgi:hypothetical protein
MLFDRRSVRFPALLALVFAAALMGCPPVDDDDDSSNDEPDGEAPVVTNVELCEVPVTPEWCAGLAWVVEFRINATDEDCDLENPYWFISIGGNPSDGRLEGTLGSEGCGGRLDVGICSEDWVRGADISFEVWMMDAAGNQGEGGDRYEGTWTVPEAGQDDCGPG